MGKDGIQPHVLLHEIKPSNNYFSGNKSKYIKTMLILWKYTL